MLRIYRKSERLMDHPKTQSLYRYWSELRRGRDAPSRSEVDPRRIADALDSMFILEALDTGQLRFRLAGTALCEMMGMEARGLLAETLMTEEHGDEILDLARRVLATPGVGVMRVRSVDGEGEAWAGETLLLPLRSEIGDLDRVLGCVALEGASRRRRPAAPTPLRCLGSRLLPIETGPGETGPDPLLGAPRRRPLRERAPEPVDFAEPAEPFRRGPSPSRPPAGLPAPADRPRLTAIDGNPDAPRDAEPPRGRPRLRIVKD